MKWTVKGDIPSMKNTMRMSRRGTIYHEGNAVNCYKHMFAVQTPAAHKKNIDCDVTVLFIVYQKDHLKDYHNAQDLIFDCLQSSGVIKNDRQIIDWHGHGMIDKKDTRVEIEVEEIK